MRSNYLVLFFLFVALCCCGGDACNPPPKLDKCTISSWSAWSTCSVICGHGTSTRTRWVETYKKGDKITRYRPADETTKSNKLVQQTKEKFPACPPFHESKECLAHTCPVHCVWGQWSQWSECSPCSPMSRSRTRKVVKAALFGGRECSGSSYQIDLACISTSTCEEVSCKPTEFTCSDELTCVRTNLQCNGDDDCTDLSDEQDCDDPHNVCSTHYDGIPNINIAGSGYDILRDHWSGNIMDNERYNGRCLTVRSGDHDEIFRKPENIQTYHFQAYADTFFNTKSFESAKFFFHEEKEELANKITGSASYGYIAAMSAKVSASSSSNVRKVIEKSSRSDSKYFKITSKVTVARFRILRDNFILSVPFRRRLTKLPDHYDYKKYSEVIDDFGTHFYSSGTLGGKYEFIYRYSREALRESTLSDAQQKDCLTMEASFSYLGLSLGSEASTCSGNSLSQRNNGSFTRSASEVISSVLGGTSDTAASLSFANQRTPNSLDYKAWVQTVKNNPAIIDFTLSPISNTLTGQRKTNMERVLYEYLMRYDPAVCRGSCDNGGSFIVAEGGKVCKCLCAAGFTGPSCSTEAGISRLLKQGFLVED